MQRSLHLRKNNYQATLRFSFVVSLILLNGYVINSGNVYVNFFIFLQGFLLISLFAPLHECSHSTAFKSKFLNHSAMFFCGLVHLMPSNWFKDFHMHHHRYTQDKNRDPELRTRKPQTVASYIFLITGLKIWIDLVDNFLRLLLGITKDSYIDKSSVKKVVLEARIVFLIYLFLFFLSYNLGTTILLHTWIIPMIIGQPFLRLFLLAEHTNCDLTTEMEKNSRSTKTNLFVRFFMWNMNYHTEHHSKPGIPFHKMYEYQKNDNSGKFKELGYLNFHKNYLKDLLNQKNYY